MKNLDTTLRWNFPIISLFIRNGLLCGLIPLFPAFFCWALGYDIIAGALLCIAVGLFGLWIDRDCLNRWLMAPTVWPASVCIFCGALGPLLMFTTEPYLMRYLSASFFGMQLAISIGFTTFFIAYACVRPSMVRMPSFRSLVENNRSLSSTLIGACYVCLIFGVVMKFVGIVSGSADRGVGGEDAYYQVFGIWTYFIAFQHLGTVGFILVPWAFLKSNFVFKFLIAGCVSFIILFDFLGGSRQGVIAPFVLFTLGYYAFIGRPRFRLEHIILLSFPFLAFVFVFLDAFRNTDAFQNNSLTDPLARIKAIGQAEEVSQEKDQSGLYVLGERFVGNIDYLVFELTPDVIPHAYFDNARSIMWMYIPSFFYPYKPVMLDGKLIAQVYLGRLLIRTSIGTTLTGDVYRRFGWIGLPLVMAIIGALYGLYIRVIIHHLKRLNLFAISIWLCLSAYFLKDANLTVTAGIWHLAYNIPKQAFMLFLVFCIVRYINRHFNSAELHH
jgi:hypothetical protein